MNIPQETLTIQITFPGGGTEDLLVTPVGLNLYRLEESPIFGDAEYHDVIEAERLPGGHLRLVRVVTPSGFKTFTWLIRESEFDSPVFNALLDRVIAVGGNWERICGGMLKIHLPPEEASLVGDDLVR